MVVISRNVLPPRSSERVLASKNLAQRNRRCNFPSKVSSTSHGWDEHRQWATGTGNGEMNSMTSLDGWQRHCCALIVLASPGRKGADGFVLPWLLMWSCINGDSHLACTVKGSDFFFIIFGGKIMFFLSAGA